MRELTFPRPADSSRHIAGLVTVTLEDGERVRFAHVGDTIYVRDVDLGIWDRAYMTCIAHHGVWRPRLTRREFRQLTPLKGAQSVEWIS